MKDKTKVLFICIHNSGRSQMAEAFLQLLAGDKFHVESAGLEPRPINPDVIKVMDEVGIDLSSKKSDSVFDFFAAGRLYNYVITVCDQSVENKCPVFAGITKRLNWPFPDPSKVTGPEQKKMSEIRLIRDNIKKQIKDWVDSLDASSNSL